MVTHEHPSSCSGIHLWPGLCKPLPMRQKKCPSRQPASKKKANPKAYHEQLRRELPGEAWEAIKRALNAFKGTRDSNALVNTVVDVLRQPGRLHLLSGFSVFLPNDGCAHLRKCIKCVSSMMLSHVSLNDCLEPIAHAVIKCRRVSAQLNLLHLIRSDCWSDGDLQLSSGCLHVYRQIVESHGSAGDSARSSAKAEASAAPAGTGMGGKAEAPLTAAGTHAKVASTGTGAGSIRGAGPAAGSSAAAAAGVGIAAGSKAGAQHASAAGSSAAVGTAAAVCAVCHVSPMSAAWAAPCAHVACWPCWMQSLQAKHACPKCAAPTQRHQLRQKFFA